MIYVFSTSFYVETILLSSCSSNVYCISFCARNSNLFLEFHRKIVHTYQVSESQEHEKYSDKKYMEFISILYLSILSALNPFDSLIDPDHGQGQYTEKRIHLSNRLPSWIRSLVPKIFYITEKAWNYYPFTITEYTCSFVPRFAIHIQTKYLNDKGTTDNVSDFF